MKIGALIPVRLGSERLPEKHLKKILGKPVLYYLLERVFSSRYIHPSNVIVCTTCDQRDDALESIVEGYGARIFRGATDDIIDRFYHAVKTHDFDLIAEIDGDDPCFDPGYMDRCIEKILEHPQIDVVLASGLPLGVASKVFRRSALETVYQIYSTPKNDTGFMWYFTKTGVFNVHELQPVSIDDINHEIRLTLDYLEDYEVIKRIFEKLYVPGKIISVSEMVALFRRDPDLLTISASLKEHYESRTNALAKLTFMHQGVMQSIEEQV